jgi:two-component system response regulator YesN
MCYNIQNVNSQEQNVILLNQLLFLILSDVCHTLNHETQTTPESKILTETCKYIQENFHKNITIKELANNVSLSPSYFLKMFKKNANTTPTEYIISIRLSNAKQLLTESNLTVAQIAELCGFNDASYFSYYFRRRFGMKPSEYRLNELNELK